jgi:NitT/TauT family transport system permease protein
MSPSLLAERTAGRLNPRQEQAAQARTVSPGRQRLVRGTRGVTGIIAVALAWEILPRVGLLDAYFIPPLHVVLGALVDLAQSGELWRHLRASLIRSGAGFALATSLAIPIGAAIAWYCPAREVTQPVFEIYRNTAVLALLPVFTLILGLGESAKIAIITYACFFPILLSTMAGVATVDPQLLRSARVLGLSPVTTFRKVIFPAAVPTIFTGIRIAGAASILVLIAAEMVAAKEGLGFLILYAQYNFLIPKMYAAILVTTLLGLTVNYSLVALERRFSRWRA